MYPSHDELVKLNHKLKQAYESHDTQQWVDTQLALGTYYQQQQLDFLACTHWQALYQYYQQTAQYEQAQQLLQEIPELLNALSRLSPRLSLPVDSEITPQFFPTLNPQTSLIQESPVSVIDNTDSFETEINEPQTILDVVSYRHLPFSFFQQCCEQLPFSLCIINREGHLLYLNRVSCDLFAVNFFRNGLIQLDNVTEQGQFYQLGTTTLYPVEKFPLIKALQGDAYKVEDIEVKRNLSSSPVPLEMWSIPLIDTEHTLYAALLLCIDITQRKRLEKEHQQQHTQLLHHSAHLRETQQHLSYLQQRYQALYTFAPIGYITLDNHGKILDLNLRAAHLLGIERRHYIGQLFKVFLSASDANSFQQHCLQVLRTQQRQVCEVEVKPKKWGTLFLRLESSALSRAGEPLLLQTALTDVTEHKRTAMELVKYRNHLEELVRNRMVDLQTTNEQLQREILERRITESRLHLLESVVVNARDSILITEAEPIKSPGPRIVYVNSAFTQMTGYSLDEIIDKTPRILQGEKTDKATLDKLREALNNWQSIQVELINYRKDGSEFWINFQVFPIADEHGWYTHWVAIQRDVTERKEVEKNLQLAKEAAESANQAKSTFLTNMSHELRTPLNGILGYAQILERDINLTEKQHIGVRTIRRSGEHLLMLINDILDLAKIEVGRFSLVSIDFVLTDLVEEMMELFQAQAQQHDIEFHSILDLDLPGIVRGDIKRLRQVLLNLLGNAIKFTSLVKGRRRIVSFKIQYQNDHAYFEVKDTGIGIPSSQLEKIFMPFEQLGCTQQQQQGTGLGLSISQRLINLMGSELHVESMVDYGSRFWFSILLPVTQAQNRNSINHLISEITLGYQRTDAYSYPFKILVVDDNPDNRQLMHDLLEPLGFEILLATQGAEALQILQTQFVDGLITDLKMPVMTGIELLEKLANLKKLPPVIFVTSADLYSARQLNHLPSHIVLTKPIDINQLLKALESNLPLKWQRKSLHSVSADSEISHNFPIPPLNFIDELIAEIRKGKIKNILDQIYTLDAEIYGEFIAKIKQLADNFEIVKLQKFLNAIKEHE